MAGSSQFHDYVEQVRAKSPLLDLVIEALGKPETGSTMFCCCFHNDAHPSMSVTPSRGLFHCHGCHVGGDVFRFIELREGISFRQALDCLAQRAGLPAYRPHPQEAQRAELDRGVLYVTEWVARYFHERLMETPAAQRYLTETRGLPADLLDRFCLGWADGGAVAHVAEAYGRDWVPVMEYAGLARPASNAASWVNGAPTHRDLFFERIIFPSMDNGQPMFLSGRATQEGQSPKYLHQIGREAPLYNSDALHEAAPEVFVVEGPLDTLSLAAWGLPAVGLQGGFRARAVRALRSKARRVVVCLDADRAGMASAMKLAAGLGVARLRIVSLPDGQDPNDYYRTGTKEGFLELVGASQGPVEYGLGLVPPGADPTTLQTSLEPVLRLLAAVSPLESQGWIDGVIGPKLKLSRRGVQAVEAEVAEYRAAGHTACPACGTTLRTS